MELSVAGSRRLPAGRGARADRNIAGLYSLVGSCIANGVEPTEFLLDVLPRIAGANSDEELDALLPDRWRPTGPAP